MPSPFGDILAREITQASEAFLESRRPPEEIRDQVDLACRVDGLSVLVYGIRPSYRPPHEVQEEPVAKTTYVKSKGIWKVYWMRADLKWHAYGPCPEVSSIAGFYKLVDEDKYACFFG